MLSLQNTRTKRERDLMNRLSKSKERIYLLKQCASKNMFDYSPHTTAQSTTMLAPPSDPVRHHTPGSERKKSAIKARNGSNENLDRSNAYN